MGARARVTTACCTVAHAVVKVIALLALVGAGPAIAAGDREGPRACLAIASDEERLACYDREVRKLMAPSFAGRLARTTERFLVDGPTLLRYQSDGAIFVLYLKAADGEVLQNLHIGGGGEASYLIDRPGTYFLDVHGSESWRIWLEPQNAPPIAPKTN